MDRAIVISKADRLDQDTASLGALYIGETGCVGRVENSCPGEGAVENLKHRSVDMPVACNELLFIDGQVLAVKIS